ncbi:MAG: hypothetical protein ACFFCF_07215 [Promethearchaeota archaeon]
MRGSTKITAVLLGFSFLLFHLSLIQCVSASYPVGLILKYHISDDFQGDWDEQFTILEEAPECGQSILFIEFSSTLENSLHGHLYLNTSSWNLIHVDGTVADSPLQPPLWVDTSTWHIGDTIHLPTYSGTYLVSSEYVSLSFGTFLCWRIQSVAWFSIDDDYQQCTQNWYFHYSEGILIKYTYELLPSQHAIYSHKSTRELSTTNFLQYGILSVEEQIQLSTQTLGFSVVLLIILLGSIFLYQYHRQSRKAL